MRASNRDQFSAPPTQRQWLAAFIKQELANAFPDLVSKDQVDKQFHATRLAWTQSRFAQFDSDMDNQLSVGEFNKLGTKLSMHFHFALADKDDDKSVSVEELFEYLESGSPTQPKVPPVETTSSAISDKSMRWAAQRISQYDRNGDGVLTANEWGGLTFKASGADANNDDVITEEELVAYRIATYRLDE
jgi:Ca2+-binding EF-hand superfamily protein